jgi:PEP-CTERM motif
MRCYLAVCALLVAVLLLFTAPQVRADGWGDDNFSFIEQLSAKQTLTVDWRLPAAPGTSATYLEGIGFAEVGVNTSYFLNGFYEGTTRDAFLFLSDAAGGGFMDGLNFGLGGTNQVYMGPEDNPIFVPGTYAGYASLNLDANGNWIPASLTVRAPEPSSLLLLCMGFLAFLGTVAAKKLQA